jgi:hypothetical protein
MVFLWVGIGFYESIPALLWSRPEVFLHPVLLVALLSLSGVAAVPERSS